MLPIFCLCARYGVCARVRVACAATVARSPKLIVLTLARTRRLHVRAAASSLLSLVVEAPRCCVSDVFYAAILGDRDTNNC